MIERYLLYAALGLAVASGIWMHGYSRGEIKLFEYQAEQALAAVPVIVRQGEVTEKIITRWRTKAAEIVVRTEVIEKEIVRYVPAAADPVLGAGWVWMHDRAATGAISEAPAGADVAAPAIASSQALKGIVGNYGTCHGYVLQLLTLQAWVQQQYEVMNREPLRY